MPRPTIAAFVILCCSFLVATAVDQTLEKQLAGQYHNKILYLRHAFISDAQEYDAQGNLVNPSDEGPWSLYGRMVVTKIALDKDSLRIEGKRAVYRTDGQLCGQGCMPFGNGKATTIKIRLTGPLASLSDADSVLSRVFAITPEDTVKSVPSYWQEYVAKLITPQDLKQPEANAHAGSDKVFKFGDQGVTMAKPTYAPEPDFTEVARKERFQGVVGLSIIVDKSGHVSRVSIFSPLGMGLDEQAANMVRTWRFSPATQNGEPVAIALNVEVDFHLYSRR